MVRDGALACPDLFGLPCWFCPGPGSHASFTLLSVAISFDALWTRSPPDGHWDGDGDVEMGNRGMGMGMGMGVEERAWFPARRHNPGRHCGVKWAVQGMSIMD